MGGKEAGFSSFFADLIFFAGQTSLIPGVYYFPASVGKYLDSQRENWRMQHNKKKTKRRGKSNPGDFM